MMQQIDVKTPNTNNSLTFEKSYFIESFPYIKRFIKNKKIQINTIGYSNLIALKTFIESPESVHVNSILEVYIAIFSAIFSHYNIPTSKNSDSLEAKRSIEGNAISRLHLISPVLATFYTAFVQMNTSFLKTIDKNFDINLGYEKYNIEIPKPTEKSFETILRLYAQFTLLYTSPQYNTEDQHTMYETFWNIEKAFLHFSMYEPEDTFSKWFIKRSRRLFTDLLNSYYESPELYTIYFTMLKDFFDEIYKYIPTERKPEYIYYVPNNNEHSHYTISETSSLPYQKHDRALEKI